MAILATAYCQLSITYDASGRKWKKEGAGGKREYILGIEYLDGKLEAIFGPDGRLAAVFDENGVNITGFRPEYWHTDHLGNVRLAFSDVNNNGRIEIEDDPGTPEDDTEIMQENHYYPFGMNQLGPWYETVVPPNKYQYNGKELNEELGLDWYDYGARWYDASIGRWNAVDPLADQFAAWSPYSYVFNNPLIFIDPDGRVPETVKPTGETEEQRQASLQMIRNTLTAEDAKFVQLDADGNIDRGLINSRESSSGNFNSLKDMVNSDMVLEVSLAESFDYIDGDGNPGTSEMPYLPTDEFSEFDTEGNTMSGTSTGESGFLGKTLFPDKNGLQNSPDGTVKVIVNKNLSEPARAEMYSHEGNGHAYIYMMNGGAKARERASHQPVNFKETNTELSQRIIRSKKETIQNMRQK
jgi:RHS repeat-associated protein